MSRIKIDKVVERKLYAESMGRCMNPECQVELFINDGDMIEKAHIGVAMANGFPKIKEVANYITTSNEESGVAHAINKFVNNIES